MPRILDGIVYALVTARGGSKGVPRKNLLPLAGKPMLLWSIEAARTSPAVNRVLLSTEDEEIARIGRDGGAEVPFLRPRELAGDTSPHIDVVLHALHWLEENESALPEHLLLLQPTSPLRAARDLDAAVALARQLPPPPAVISVCEAPLHPYWAQTVLHDGTLQPLYPEHEDTRRQDLPPLYCLNGAIYLTRVAVLLRERTLTPRGARAYVMPPERSIDVDTPWDFRLADLIMRETHALPAD
jgi:CMP-N-acetylneuraminic acid synthetase